MSSAARLDLEPKYTRDLVPIQTLQSTSCGWDVFGTPEAIIAVVFVVVSAVAVALLRLALDS